MGPPAGAAATARYVSEGVDVMVVTCTGGERGDVLNAAAQAEVEQVKGLEFDYVVLVEASATSYPDTAQSRRRLHVGATRAVTTPGSAMLMRSP